MADTTTTPNMNLVLPNVSECPGPAWATDNNAAFNGVDSHNHSSGQGVQINPAGLNINTDLTMAGNNLTHARSVRFTPQGSPIAGAADLGCIYEAGVDLYYNDGSGNQVRITQGGSIVGSAGSISGLPSGTASASYAAGVFTWQAATNVPATMNSGPLVIGAAATANSKTVTLTPTNTLAANYVLTFPTGLPGTLSLATIDAAGNIATTTAPTLSGGTLNGTYAGNPTFSGTPTFSGAVLNGTYSGNPTFSGTASFSGVIEIDSGSVGAPSIAFTGDTSTGFYHSAANQVAIAIGGTNVAKFISTGLRLLDGSAASPATSFSDVNSGLYSSGAGEIGFATTGIQRANVNNSGFRVISGSASNPSYSFLTDNNTGLYNSSDGAVNIASNGTNVIQASTDGLASGTITAASSIKWIVFSSAVSGQIPASSSRTLTAPTGIVISYTGLASRGADRNRVIYDDNVTTSSVNALVFNISASGNDHVSLQNTSASAQDYTVLMFYQ